MRPRSRPPDESLAPILQTVDFVELGDEVRHLRVVEVIEHTTDVVLGELLLGHDGALTKDVGSASRTD